MSSAVNPLTSSTPPNAGASSSNSLTSTAGALANQSTFLQLMISELEHQDPTNPTDGTQFLTQLAQFSSVASQTQSATDLDSILSLMQQSQAAAAAPTNTPNAAQNNAKQINASGTSAPGAS